MAKIFRGIISRQENRPSEVIRDLRPVWLQTMDMVLSRQGIVGCLGVVAIIIWFFPALDDILLAVAVGIFWYSFWKTKRLPFKMPIFSGRLDYNDVPPGSQSPSKAKGIYFFGNDINNKDQLWFSNADMRTHTLIFGSTGSGKTEALVSIAYNALLQGSGFIYVDGKGDNALFAKIFSICRSLGREDDLLIINFMTGASDIVGPQEHILSNTFNPFATGSSSMLSQLVVSLMDSGGGSTPAGGADGDMWRGRAIAFIEALMRPLVWMRDNGYTLLDANVIRRYFILDVLEDLLYDKKLINHENKVITMDKALPFDVRDSLENYLSTLPGYQKTEKGKQSGKAYEQHGYITMQLTRVFGSLADVYGHIVRSNLAEVDVNDVVLNRRILVVLLPALEKSPDELSNLGKLIIASLKSMLAAGLGSRVEGDYKDVIETKPTNSSTPYLCVLDEYGYYAVKGFAVVPAQARSLGFSVVFAGQDLPAFQKASKEEAASICANTNVKICMKLEDPVETWDFFQKTAGEAYVSVARSFNKNSGNMGGMSYRDSMEATIDKRNRIDLLDLKDQREGEAHVFFKSTIVRASMFYANPKQTKAIKINQMLKVQKPASEATQKLRALTKVQYDKVQFDDATKDSSLSELFGVFADHTLKTQSTELYKALDGFIAGHVDEEQIDFGSQETNPSIFMSIPVDERLGSEFFDVEVSNLQDALLTKEKLYEVVKRLAILEGQSESYAKDVSHTVINRIESETSYANCDPRGDGDVGAKVETLIKTGL